jgi:GT2 family glycosyltransferase
MRVLAHVHTFNDADIIDRTIDGLLRQTRLPDAIVLVDNGSTDGTLDRVFSELVAIIRNPTNLGTSGAVRNGFIHALKHQFDWIWLFDADSVPEPDALQRLLDLYASFPEEMREQIGFLSCLPCDQRDGQPRHGGLFTRLGLTVARPAPERRYYPCHATIWSGCLYRLAAVRRIGLPNPNYVLDRGEDEYGYRVMKAGYKAFIHQGAVLRHNVRGTTSLTEVNCTLGPVAIKFYEFPSIRCYYTCRNTLYFALYEAAEGRFGLLRGALWRMRPSPERPGFMRGAAWRVLLLTLNFLLRPSGHGAQILACLRGIWHGVTGNIRARY